MHFKGSGGRKAWCRSTRSRRSKRIAAWTLTVSKRSAVSRIELGCARAKVRKECATQRSWPSRRTRTSARRRHDAGHRSPLRAGLLAQQDLRKISRPQPQPRERSQEHGHLGKSERFRSSPSRATSQTHPASPSTSKIFIRHRSARRRTHSSKSPRARRNGWTRRSRATCISKRATSARRWTSTHSTAWKKGIEVHVLPPHEAAPHRRADHGAREQSGADGQARIRRSSDVKEDLYDWEKMTDDERHAVNF
jgi:hypothetical protein